MQGVSFEKDGLTFKGSEIDRQFSHANLTKTLNRNFEKWFNAYVKPDEPIAPTVKEKETPTIVPSQERREQPSPETLKPSTQATLKQSEPPHPAKKTPTIGGVRLTTEQWETLQSGGHIYLENMERKDGNGKFSSHVFLDDERRRMFYCKTDPDQLVQFGAYEMRLRDKKQVEFGLPTRVIIRLPSGELTGARLSKENPTDTDFKVLWDDPRIAKEQQELKNREQEDQRRTITPPKKGLRMG